MSDITLTASARQQLLSLIVTDRLVQRTSERLATGLRVSDPADDAPAFFQARGLRDTASDLNLRRDEIDQTISALNASRVAADAVERVVKQLQGILASIRSLQEYGTGKAAHDASDNGLAEEQIRLNRLFDDTLDQINNIVQDASYGGTNYIGDTDSRIGVWKASETTLVLSENPLSTITVRGTFLGNAAVIDSRASTIQAGWDPSIAGGNKFYIATANGFNRYVALNATDPADNIPVLVQDALAVVPFPAGRLENEDAQTALAATDPNFLFGLTNFQSAGSGFTDRTANIVAFSYNRPNQPFMAGGGANGNGSLGNVFDFEAAIGNPADDQSILPRIGLGILYSWMYENLATGAGRDAAARDLEFALGKVRGAQGELATTINVLTQRLTFNSARSNELTTGAEKLTLIDLNREGANLVALQTRQQLGIESLQFSGEATSSILNLFTPAPF